MPERLTRSDVERQLSLLDFAIFDALPDEGGMLGYHPLYKTVKQLRHELNAALPEGAPQLTTGELAARMRTLNQVGGLVVPVSARSLSGKIDGYQRTSYSRGLLEAAKMEGRYTPVGLVQS